MSSGGPPLDEAARRRQDLPPGATGAVILSVDPAFDAARQGLRTGDVIVRVNNRAVAGPADLSEAVAAARRAGRDSVLLLVQRDRRQRAVPVRPMDRGEGGPTK